MATKPLVKRVSILEQEVAALKKALLKEGAPKDWRRAVGMFEGDEIMQEIDKLTLAVREEDRLQRAADEELLEETSRAASTAKFRIEDTEKLIKQHRREKAKKTTNGDA